jgi:transcription elongation factor SPT6
MRTLQPGFIVAGFVQSVETWVVKVSVQGLDGKVDLDHVADEPVSTCVGLATVGQSVQAKVIKVEPEKLLVKLSLRESDLAAGDVAVRRTPPELPWDYAQELTDGAAAQKDKRTSCEVPMRRLVDHPSWRDISGQKRRRSSLERCPAISSPGSCPTQIAGWL